MCKFLSLVSDGAGNIMYFNSEQRKKIIAKKMKDKNGNAIAYTDSHSSILAGHGIYGEEEDMYNKYEYNPLTKEFEIDQLNNKNDSENVKKQCLELDFKTIVPELQIKEIINPISVQHGDTVNDTEIALLHMWDSVMASVRTSVWDSVRDSVMASVGTSVWASVWDSVGTSVRASVWASVKDSVRASVGGSVMASVWDSVRAYISSFFVIRNWKYIAHEPNKNPFQPCIDLWNLGLVPSFNGRTCRLHKMCDSAKVIYEEVLD
jgi:hypothetical protein